MVQLTTRERVDAYWSRSWGVDAADLHAPGVRVIETPPERAWRGVYVLAFDQAVSVFCPRDLWETAAAAVADRDPAVVLEPETWHEALGDAVQLAFGPVVHHYLDSVEHLPETTIGRRINPQDAHSLTELRGALSADEWLSAGFTAQAAMLFAIFDDDRIVAAANLTEGPEAATDVGVIIHPAARGKGYAIQVAALAARQALLMHGVARFRALATSEAALAIATKLGFVEYGRNLAVYLTG